MDEPLVALLRQLVAIPSMNPYRARALGGGYGEQALATHVAAFLRDAGLAVELREALPGRPNVFATLDGPDALEPLLFVSHLDTVPVDGMTIEPFAATVEGGRLFGRGACDTKGSMAAMLAAIQRVAHAKTQRSAILYAATVDEEDCFSGIRALAESRPRARAAIVGEPTRLDVVIAHRGVARCKIATRGKSAHSSCPEQGINAIYRMAPLLADLEALAGQLLEHPPHPMVGGPRLSVGTIAGGHSVNTIPDRCVVDVDRRLLPGESPDEAYQPLRDIARRHGATLEPFFQAPALEMPADAEIVRRAAEAVRAVTGDAKIVGAPYGTEAPVLAQAGIPAVVLGPGDSAKAHSSDESIPLDQLEAACQIYQRLMAHDA